MELFRNKELQQKDGDKIMGEEALQKKVTGILFSAGWCPPCTEFLPFLQDMYEQLQSRHAQFEIVFISFDKTEADMANYIEQMHGEWLSVPWGDPMIQQMKDKFQVNAVPKLVIVKPSGEVITWKGRKEVQDRGIAAYRTWFDHSGLERLKIKPTNSVKQNVEGSRSKEGNKADIT